MLYLKKILNTFFYTLTLLLFNSIAIAENLSEPQSEKQLLADAIKVYSSLSTQDDIKTRIRKQEVVIKKIDEIVDNFSGTDAGIEILISGDFGKYNINAIRKKYMDELIAYNLKTCKSEPSFNCLGFVSLDNGLKGCDIKDDFSGIITASKNFRNAYSIFSTQGDGQKYKVGILSSFKNCAAGQSDFKKDFLHRGLINILLDSGDENKAVGITQNMKTPIFKLLAAADIRSYQGKLDYKTLKVLFEKAENLSNKTDQNSAMFTLINTAYKENLDPYSKGAKKAKIAISFPPTYSYNESPCGEQAQGKYLSELAMDFLFLDSQVERSPYLTINAREKASEIIEQCSNYALQPINYFLKTDLKSAKAIREFQSQLGNGQKINTDFFVKNIPLESLIGYVTSMEEEINESTMQLKAAGTLLKGKELEEYKRSIKLQPMHLRKFYIKQMRSLSGTTPIYPFEDEYGKFNLYKLYIDNGDVCRASETLFKDIRGGDYEEESVTYFITSPNILVNKKYNCGDGELDLLLN